MSESVDLVTIGNWFSGPAKDSRVSKVFAKRMMDEIRSLREEVARLKAAPTMEKELDMVLCSLSDRISKPLRCRIIDLLESKRGGDEGATP